MRRAPLAGLGAPPPECAGTLGGCAAAVDDACDGVAHALDLNYCDACQSSWRTLGGWCSAEDERVWYEARGLHAPSSIVRCAGMTLHGARCKVNSLSAHDGAQPLRDGERFCALHMPPAVAQHSSPSLPPLLPPPLPPLPPPPPPDDSSPMPSMLVAPEPACD